MKEIPKASMYEIDQSIKGKTPERCARTITFDKEIMAALGDACLDKQQELASLVEQIIKDWLKKNLYVARDK